MRPFATVRNSVRSTREATLALWAIFIALCGLSVNSQPTSARLPEITRLDGQILADPGSGNDHRAAAGDTTYFGFVDENGFAIPGETWTWDHGAPDPFEGWTLIERSVQGLFRHLTAGTWSDGGNSGVAPLLSGDGSIWVGLNQNEADLECWEDGTGYGNNWLHSFRSPVLTWNGIDPVTLSFEYFNDSEDDFDMTCLQLRHSNGNVMDLRNTCFTGQVGISGDDAPTGQFYSVDIDGSDFGSSTTFEIVFTMTSDGGWSDEDGQYTTKYGAFGVDDIILTGGILEGPQAFDFETGLQGWISEVGVGGTAEGYLVVQDVGTYDIPPGELEDCDIEANVLAFHDENGQHSSYTAQKAISPPVNLAALDGYQTISATLQQFTASNQNSDIFFRIGWDYYPFICEVTGEPTWSGRVGQATFFNGGPGCFELLPEASPFVPVYAEQVRLIYEIVSSCIITGTPEPDCTDNSDFSPILDNVRIRAIGFDDPSSSPLPPVLSTNHGKIEQGRPNPFRTETTISFEVTVTGPVTLTIHDSAGRRIRSLTEGTRPAGHYREDWDGADDHGRSVPAGVYWARLGSSGQSSNLRIVRIE